MTYEGKNQFEGHVILNEVKNRIAFNAPSSEAVELRSI